MSQRGRLRDGVGARLAFGLLVLAFCAGPVPGDVGGCGQSPQALDRAGFFESKRALDCSRCTECGLVSELCESACDPAAPPERLPRGCDPLEHDGDVCLRALLSSSCDEYERFVRDQAPETPTECNFCPRGGQ